MGRARRRLYKPDRDRWTYHQDGRRYFDTARAKHWKPDPGTKLTEADLSLYEAELGVRAIGQERYQMRVGRILDYDPLGNKFLVVGKGTYLHLATGKWMVDEARLVERWIPGPDVAAAIVAGRMMIDRHRIERPMSGR